MRNRNKQRKHTNHDVESADSISAESSHVSLLTDEVHQAVVLERSQESISSDAPLLGRHSPSQPKTVVQARSGLSGHHPMGGHLGVPAALPQALSSILSNHSLHHFVLPPPGAQQSREKWPHNCGKHP